jgi:predicted nucleotidyltransferase
MNLTHPLSSLIPTLSGPVLEVLAHTTKPLAGREVLRLLSREASQQGVQNVLDELAAHGLVTQMAAGNSVLNTLNRDHILAPVIIRIAGMRDELLADLATIVTEGAPEATRAILFGSLARDEADEESDIDLILIWDDAVPKEGTSPVEDISSRIYQLTGNSCRILYYTTSEFEALPDRAPDLHSAVSTEGIDLLAPVTR